MKPRHALLLALAACGGSKSGSDGGTAVDAAPIDTPPAPFCQPTPGTALALVPIVTGLRQPVGIAAPIGDSRLFILEQPGRIRVVKDGTLLPTPFLDLDAVVNATDEEQGLLGLAFHPRFADNGRFFVYYTTNGNNVVVAEYAAAAGADTAGTTERRLLDETHQYGNHNGGTLAFGPDGFLYISIGDGGGGDNFLGNGQRTTSKLSKILRIDVDQGAPYGIPPTNPWAGGGGVPEMYAWGLRNPWRFAIDGASGDLYIGDVGQGAFEEIDLVPAGQAGKNFGWAVFEGPECFTADSEGNAGCDNPGAYAAPLLAIDRRTNGENSVIAGAVYRGTCMPDYAGTFFFGDYGSGRVKTLKVVGGVATDVTDRTADVDPTGLLYQQLASFGVDGFGELYVAARTSGRVYRIEVE
ncbi:MAG: PQQ-dependent sugar dehydrogenase [Myxococcales bacterium]|nr:PQQ-dependent sugar dehydrogenase [Myxococcales bacterium]